MIPCEPGDICQHPDPDPLPPPPGPGPNPEPDPNPGGGQPLPMPDPTPGGSGIECPNWNTCTIDISSGAMQSYWDANNAFLNSMGNTTLGYELLSLGGLTLAYLTGTQVISAESIALILGISIIDPTPIEEFLIIGGLTVAAVAVTASLAMNDIQDVNNAIVTSGALQNGGSIVADWDGATITTSQGTTYIDTLLPFSAQISLGVWASQSPLLSPIP